MRRFWFILTVISLTFGILTIPSMLIVQGKINLPIGTVEPEIYEETYDNKNHTKIKVTVDANLKIIQGEKDSIRVEAKKSIMETMNIKKTSKTISVEPKNDFYLNLDPLNSSNIPEITISIKNLEELEVGGKTKVNLDNYKAKNLKIVFDSSDYLISNSLEVESLEIQNLSFGFMTLKGKATDLNLLTRASARTLLRELSVETATIQAEGSGGIELRVNQTLDVNISGSSPIRYLGAPEIKKTKTGTGFVESF